MVNKSHYDPAKEKWREAWYQFVRKHRNSLRGSPKDWQVVFFPGEEALEIDVYNRLKIPRENLLGLERDPKVHEKLRKKKLGIRLTDEPMDALDFFAQTEERFTIGSLDYQGQLTTRVVQSLRYLAGRQILDANSIFGITTYNKRENEETKNIYRRAIAAREFNKFVASGNIEPLRGRNESLTELIRSYGYTQEQMVKHLGHTDAITGVFLSGTENTEINPIFLRNPRFRAIDEAIEDATIAQVPGITRTNMHTNDVLYRVHLYALSQNILASGLGADTVSAQTLAALAIECQSRPYIPTAISKYQYTSGNSGSMISDFFVFTQYREQLEKFRYIAEHAYVDLNPIVFMFAILNNTPIFKISPETVDRVVRRTAMILCNRLGPSQIDGPREFLGSSAKLPPITGQDYYKQRYSDEQQELPLEDTFNVLIQNFRIKGKDPRKKLRGFDYWYGQEKYGPRPTSGENNGGSQPKENLEAKISHDKFELIPHQYWDKLPDNFKQRIAYFIQDDLTRADLQPDQARRLVGEIRASKWYKTLNGHQLSDSQFYAFFDDIVLETLDGNIPDRRKVAELFEDVMKPNWREKGISKTKPVLTLADYERLSFYDGRSDDWILERYSTSKPNSVRAYKAWVTMRHKGKTEKPQDLGLRVARMIRSGRPKAQIMQDLDLQANQVSGFMAAYKRGAYNKQLGLDRKSAATPNIYVDSHGVVHVGPSRPGDIEKGYK